VRGEGAGRLVQVLRQAHSLDKNGGNSRGQRAAAALVVVEERELAGKSDARAVAVNLMVRRETNAVQHAALQCAGHGWAAKVIKVVRCAGAHLDAHCLSDVVGEQRGQGQDSAVEYVGASKCGRCIAEGGLVGSSCRALGEQRRQELRGWGGS
jgi:hypothetical protein